MPELPEVETIRRGLEKRILGLKITKIDVREKKSFVGDKHAAEGRAVKDLRRFGKALIIDLEGGVSLMVHLRMTGQMIYDAVEGVDAAEAGEAKKIETGGAEIDGVSQDKNAKKPDHNERYAAGHPSENFVAKLPNKQTRVVIHLSRGVLYFNDQRKFGFIKVLQTAEVAVEDFIRKLAPEPWQMTAEEFYARLQRHPKSLIKAVLLDQTIICGLGNIYADEALFAAKIHPERRAGTLDKDEAKKLLISAREVMDRSIASGGSTMATYVKADGSRGDYLEKFAQVFRREGQPCPRCGTEIIKTRVAGRGTHLCPKCQQLEQGNEAKSGAVYD